MQLWTRMASQQAAQNHHNNTHRSPSPPPLISSPSPFTNTPLPSSPNNQLSGLAASLSRLHFSKDTLKAPTSTPSEKSSPIVSALLSGKHIPGASMPSPSSFSSRKEKEISYSPPEHQQAFVAALASQTLLRRLGGAFWDALSGPPALPNAHGYREVGKLDVEKVRRVLEGKAFLQVVDIEPMPMPMSMPAMSRKDINIKDEKKKCDMTFMLEESMRSLSIVGKK